jgi:hypothetical protein
MSNPARVLSKRCNARHRLARLPKRRLAQPKPQQQSPRPRPRSTPQFVFLTILHPPTGSWAGRRRPLHTTHRQRFIDLSKVSKYPLLDGRGRRAKKKAREAHPGQGEESLPVCFLYPNRAMSTPHLIPRVLNRPHAIPTTPCWRLLLLLRRGLFERRGAVSIWFDRSIDRLCSIHRPTDHTHIRLPPPPPPPHKPLQQCHQPQPDDRGGPQLACRPPPSCCWRCWCWWSMQPRPSSSPPWARSENDPRRPRSPSPPVSMYICVLLVDRGSRHV